MKHVILLNVVGLAPGHLNQPDLLPNIARLAQHGWSCPMKPTFPAVTCSMQTTLLSGKTPAEHGIIANGFYDRSTHEVKFWEQADALVETPRIWETLRQKHPQAKTAVLFWQHSMFCSADIVVTPRPLHLDSGMVQWCYSKPVGYYEELVRQIGPFKLQHYWGPLAGLASSQWIARAALHTWHHHAPELMLVYLPHLDYASQKYGPDAPQTQTALREIDAVVGELLDACSNKAAILVCSEYSLSPVTRPVYPNRILREAGLLQVREINGKEYLDFELSDAFAMVDHQVAHLFCKPHARDDARQALAARHPIDFVTIDHARAGEIIAVAPRDEWFAYYWWDDWTKAPEFAFTVDIHRKPGYDPCELWFDWRRMARTFKPATAIDPQLVKGSHGRVDQDPETWATLVMSERAVTELKPAEPVAATQVAGILEHLLG